jgi:crossover junction endodeoxyribonuclease RusA
MLNLTLPFPDPSLSPNRKHGKHWSKTNSAKVAAKETAFYLTKQASAGYIPPAGFIPLSIVFVTPDKRHRDADNMLAASKPAIDGIALALNVNDTRFKPLLVDWVEGSKPGATLICVGAQIISYQEIE